MQQLGMCNTMTSYIAPKQKVVFLEDDFLFLFLKVVDMILDPI